MPVRSMTGFGVARRPWGGAATPRTVVVEIRTGNARFLEVKVRQPFGAAVEHEIRTRVERSLGRGRADVTVHVAAPEDVGGAGDVLGELGIDPRRLDAALRATAMIAARGGAAGMPFSPATAGELLRIAAAARPAATELRDAPEFLLELADEAVLALQRMRVAEGEALGRVLGDHLAAVERGLERLAASADEEVARFSRRIEERLRELLAQVGVDRPDPGRLIQEAALVAARGDVREELDRIASHVVQFRSLLAAPPAAGQGRTLDFLGQELVREVTTLGSKTTSHEAAAVVIELKTVIERIREQVQNVE